MNNNKQAKKTTNKSRGGAGQDPFLNRTHPRRDSRSIWSRTARSGVSLAPPVAPPCGRDRGEATREERRERRLQRGTRGGCSDESRSNLPLRTELVFACAAGERRARETAARAERRAAARWLCRDTAATQRPWSVWVERWERARARARVGRLGPERVVLTAVHARGASRPRGDVHETAFAAAVEALSRRRLCRARTPQRRFEFRRTQGVRGPRGRGRHGTTERDGRRATTQSQSQNRPNTPFRASGV